MSIEVIFLIKKMGKKGKSQCVGCEGDWGCTGNPGACDGHMGFGEARRLEIFTDHRESRDARVVPPDSDDGVTSIWSQLGRSGRRK
jgi:hypothetical protein